MVRERKESRKAYIQRRTAEVDMLKCLRNIQVEMANKQVCM